MTPESTDGPRAVPEHPDRRPAPEQPFEALYDELHRLARRQLAARGERASLGATTLLHEAYLGMAGRSARFPDVASFMGYAARVMRGVIIDHVRRGRADKRGGQFHLTSIETDVLDRVAQADDLSRIGDALDALATTEPELAQIVDLKFFCGFSFAEIAAMQDASERTVQRRWEKARIYLHRALGAPPAL